MSDKGIRYPFTVQTSTGQPLGMATSVVSETSYGQVAAVGSSRYAARQDHQHGTPATPAGGIIGWCIAHNIIAPQSNPTAATYIHAHRIFAPFGINLKAYGLGLTRAGVKTDGNLYLSVWTEDATNICPGAEYASARVICFAPNLVSGWNRVPLQARGVNDVDIAAGYSWVIKTVEVKFGRTELPLDWWDGVSCGNGHAMSLLISSQGAFPDGTWDYGNSVPRSTTPGVYLLDY
jgi:hypothetical protein